MSHKQYTQDQITELLMNPYVSTCSPKSLSYTPDCKERILELYEKEGFPAREAFRILGFPSYITETSLPKDCVKSWKRILMKLGLIGLREGKKGRKKKERGCGSGGGSGGNEVHEPIDRESVEYLKAKIAYLEAENEVFRQIRAGRYQ